MGSMTFSIAYNSKHILLPQKKNMSSYLINIQDKNQTVQLLCLIPYLLVNPEYQVHAEVDQTTP